MVWKTFAVEFFFSVTLSNLWLACGRHSQPSGMHATQGADKQKQTHLFWISFVVVVGFVLIWNEIKKKKEKKTQITHNKNSK